MPTSIVASNSSAAISVNCLQPGVQCCSDCGSVNKSQTSCEGAENMKRPSIFIYQFHAAALFEPRVYICIVLPLRISPFSLVPLSISTFLALEPRGVASLERALTPPLGTLFGYVNQYVSVTGFYLLL